MTEGGRALRRGCSVFLGCAAGLFAAQPASAAAAGSSGVIGALSDWLSATEFDGRLEVGATLNPANPSDGVNFGRLATDKPNQLVLNQFDLRAERRISPGSHLDVGFAFEGSYGRDSQFNRFLGVGDQGTTARNSFDAMQANAVVGAPLGHNISGEIRGGLFVTPMGYEAIDPRDNLFYSHSYIFDFGLPRKHTGVVATAHIGSALDILAGYDTGVNSTFNAGGGPNDTQPHLLAGFVFKREDLTVKLFTHVGPEDAPSILPANIAAQRPLRYYGDLAVAWTVSPRLKVGTEVNYVRDDGLKADAGGVAQYVSYVLGPTLSVGARAEVWRDTRGAFVAGYPGNLDYADAELGLPNGAFKTGPATYGEATLGLNFRPRLSFEHGGRAIDSPFGQVTIRPEVRYDRVLAGVSGFGSKVGSARDQITVGVDLVVPLNFPLSSRREASTFGAGPVANGGDGPPVSGGDRTARSASEPPGSLSGREPPAAGESAAIRTARRAQERDSKDTAATALLTLQPTDPQAFHDFAGALPGVLLIEPSPAAIQPYIRGRGDLALHTGQSPAIGLNFDEVAIDGAFAELLDPADFATVSVTRGPAGLFTGRDAAAGAVDVTRAPPTRTWGLDARYSFEQGFHASNERIRLDAPLGPSAGLDISVSHRQRGGYLTNLYTSQPLYGRDEATAVDIGLDWSITSRLKADFNATLAHGDGQTSAPALGDPLDAQLLGPSLSAKTPGLRFNAFGSPYILGATQPLDAFQTAANGSNGESLTGRAFGLKLAYDSPFGRVTSITGFFDEHQKGDRDLDGACGGSLLGGPNCDVLANPLTPLLQVSTALRYRQISEDLRFDRDFGAFASIGVGGYVVDDRTDRSRLTQSAFTVFAATSSAQLATRQDDTDYALFAHATIHPTRRIDVSGGLRWVHDGESFSLAEPADGRGFAGNSATGRLLSRVAISYQITPLDSVYASWTTGARPGGLSLDATLSEEAPGQPNYAPSNPNANYATFKSETDAAYEIGARLNFFDQALRIDIVGYYERVHNAQISQTVLTPGFDQAFETYIANLPTVETKGVEIDADWRPEFMRGLTVFGQGAFNDARIIDGLIPGVEAPVTTLATAGARGSTYTLTGAPLVYAPRLNGSLRADYRFPPGPGTFLIDVDYRWTDRYALAVSDGRGDWQPAFGILDLTLAYERSFYRITATARNVLGAVYSTSATPAFFSHAWGAPRTAVISFAAKF